MAPRYRYRFASLLEAGAKFFSQHVPNMVPISYLITEIRAKFSVAGLGGFRRSGQSAIVHNRSGCGSGAVSYPFL